MPAAPADVAKYTNDGVVLRAPDAATSAAIKALHAEARTTGDGEIEMFFVNPDHAQVLLTEKAGLLTQVAPFHAAIETEETLGIGDTVPIFPIVPSFRCIDEALGIDVVARTRAFGRDPSTDRNSVEVIQ